jgi:hypothetical protein
MEKRKRARMTTGHVALLKEKNLCEKLLASIFALNLWPISKFSINIPSLRNGASAY